MVFSLKCGILDVYFRGNMRKRNYLEVDLHGNVDACDWSDIYRYISKIDLIPGTYHIESNIPNLQNIEITSITDKHIVVKYFNKTYTLLPNSPITLTVVGDPGYYYETDKHSSYAPYEKITLKWRIKPMTLLEQQQLAAKILKQPLDVIKELGFVDEKTKIFCLCSDFKDDNTLMSKEELKGWKGGFTFLVGPDGGVLTSGSYYSYNQLIELYLEGNRSNPEDLE